MQKIFTFLMAVSIILGLTACGGGGDNDNNDLTIQPERQEAGIIDKIKESIPGPFVGDKAGEFGEFDISTDEGYQELVDAVNDGALFLDIRNDYERSEGVDDYYASGTTKGAIYEFRPSPKKINPDFVNAVSDMVEGDKNRQIILICNSASRTSRATAWLASKTWRQYTGGEFNNVYHIKGGMEAWSNASRPMGKEPLK